MDRFFFGHDRQASMVRKAFGYFGLTWLAVVAVNAAILLVLLAGVILTTVYCLKFTGVL